ncbi:hypothetical protein NMY22_g13667 [Coprinellus aureogranulatus]|nr:hypothetical protein NMY22_g13667 [Coprinellus aureogranulatus]
MDIFLTLVDTPAIRELHYYPSYELCEHVNTAFLNRLNLHGDQLEVLSFDLPTLSDTEFVSCLRSSPSLKQLSIGPNRFGNTYTSPPFYPFETPHGRFTFTETHLSALTPKIGEECLCPRIEVLRCAMKAILTPEAVMSFLRAKVDTTLREPSTAQTRTSFKELSLVHLPFEYPIPVYRPYLEEDDEDTMKEFRKVGVVLDFARPNFYNPSGYHGSFVERVPQYETDFRH